MNDKILDNLEKLKHPENDDVNKRIELLNEIRKQMIKELEVIHIVIKDIKKTYEYIKWQYMIFFTSGLAIGLLINHTT